MAEQTKEPRLKNKVVIVTGGVQGIGRGIVDMFDEQGATIVVLDIQDEVGAAMKSTGGGEIIYIHCNVTKEDEIKNTIDEIVKRLGRIDCLVNNVGGYQGPNKIDKLSVESFKEILQLDLLSTFIACKYSLPHLRKTKGSIVNMSSCGEKTGFKNACTYIAAKGGISGLTVALAVDEAENGVRVNSVAPGATDTPLLHLSWGEEGVKQIIQCNALGKLCQPREIGSACVYLGFDATCTTGQQLQCTGGYDIGFGVKDPKLQF